MAAVFEIRPELESPSTYTALRVTEYHEPTVASTERLKNVFNWEKLERKLQTNITTTASNYSKFN